MDAFAAEPYDLSRFQFLSTIPPTDLALLLAASDLHIYMTVPPVLSWSMMNAMSCGAVVLKFRHRSSSRDDSRRRERAAGDLFDIEAFVGLARWTCCKTPPRIGHLVARRRT